MDCPTGALSDRARSIRLFTYFRIQSSDVRFRTFLSSSLDCASYVDMSTNIDELDAVEALGALAQATRMNVFRTLVRAHPQGIPAGEIAAACGVPHNTMSSHLAILT